MGTGIIVCGLNGSGKSTLGSALANKLNFHYIDNEDLFFKKSDSQYVYNAPGTRKEAELLLWKEITAHENFVFSAVKGDYGERVYSYYKYAVLIETPKDIRLIRVKNRSFQKFGDRMKSGGDLYEVEKKFFEFVEARPENLVEEWLRRLKCPILRVDGTKPIEQNVDYIISRMYSL